MKSFPYSPHQNNSPVRRKDCTELCPSYEQIRKADAPFALLDGEILCPMRGMVKGGLFLCFASMHNALDMNGQGIVLKMFAIAGRGEDFDPALVEVGNQDADAIMPLLQPGEASASHESMRRSSTLNASGPIMLHPDLPPKRVEANEDVHLQRGVDSRPILRPPVPEGYLGHLVALADTKWLTAQALSDSSLADVVLTIRESLNQVDDHFIQNFVRRARLPDVPDLTYNMPKNQQGDMHIGDCLFHEDFVDLVNDQRWRQYAELVG
ncbi:hypothetical protein B0I35DRAFT_453524 [Stachybotrys elegans]|uniref:Trichothecene 3-O-acetyltransferase n=1 Tax=Stachybotrys elegans TaxID=80388 RepID=A0A8K0SLH3_9HYPO|nr:hypothetical protein B0I35DRAFT_453524 [Stachybotrys elegans]